MEIAEVIIRVKKSEGTAQNANDNYRIVHIFICGMKSRIKRF